MSLAAGLVLMACGADDPAPPAAESEPAAPEPAEPEEEEEEEWRAAPAPQDGSLRDLKYMEPSLRELGLVMERDRYTIIANNIPAIERNFNRQFDVVNVQYAPMDPIPALLTDDIWIVHAEPALLWPALHQGVVDGVLVGVNNDTETWNLFTAPGIESPEDLEGRRFASGGPGWSWDQVARVLFDQEYGINLDDHVEWVTVSGGSDGMMQAMMAGQIDGFMGQARHIAPLQEFGATLMFSDHVDNAQGMFIVQRDTWENHQDAVCAVLEGVLEANDWILRGATTENAVDRLQYIDPMLEAHGYDTTDSEANWTATWPGTWAWDISAGVEAWDRQYEVLIAGDDPVLDPSFDWRDWVDFTCVWDLQEAYGLPLNPDPADL